MFRIYSLACLLLAAVLPSSLIGQKAAAPSHPAPEITGRFIDSDGTHLRLHYVRNARAETFIGAIQSTCMLPSESKPGESKPLNLSTIPIGTLMTVYYVRHAVSGKAGKAPENIVLGIRFDRVPDRGSTLPKGVNIPCFKAAQAPAPK
jgi:hypothetical protein